MLWRDEKAGIWKERFTDGLKILPNRLMTATTNNTAVIQIKYVHISNKSQYSISYEL
jgi:hypothetical protein